jgi:hypothetical protein
VRLNNALDSMNLVRAERRAWQENHLLAKGALNDFQKLADEAFRSMKAKYYRPADLIAEMHSRRYFKREASERSGRGRQVAAEPDSI